jgi:hypothetical protein
MAERHHDPTMPAPLILAAALASSPARGVNAESLSISRRILSGAQRRSPDHAPSEQACAIRQPSANSSIASTPRMSSVIDGGRHELPPGVDGRLTFLSAPAASATLSST